RAGGATARGDSAAAGGFGGDTGRGTGRGGESRFAGSGLISTGGGADEGSIARAASVIGLVAAGGAGVGAGCDSGAAVVAVGSARFSLRTHGRYEPTPTSATPMINTLAMAVAISIRLPAACSVEDCDACAG